MDGGGSRRADEAVGPDRAGATMASLSPLIDSIAGQLGSALGRADRVAADCVESGRRLAALPPEELREPLDRLAALIAGRPREIVEPLVALIEEWAPRVPGPAPLVRGLMAARAAAHVTRGVELAARLAAGGGLAIDLDLADELARRIENDETLAGDDDLLRATLRLFDFVAWPDAPVPGADGDARLSIFLARPHGELRRLAARLLDFGGGLPPAVIARALLGGDAHAFLRPYLEYTRATHLDLLAIAAGPDGSIPALDSLRRAQEICGLTLLADVVAELGWSRLNQGLIVEKLRGVSLNDSFPFVMRESEANLFEALPGAHRAWERFLIRAHGAPPARAGDGGEAASDIARFRGYNLAHAAILGEFLNVAPLTHDKVRWMLEQMDRIVTDYVTLFHEFDGAATILPEIHRQLREKIEAELATEDASGVLSTELTRLVQAFEDPGTAGDVRTLHGLKRFLHQRGLKLGFKLFQRGGAASRTVDFVTATPRKIIATLRRIRYADFEPGGDGATGGESLPFPVRVAADAFAHHLVHGQTAIPDVQVFCYGNEVHYYLTWLNHPAFLRIDYAPPLSGGMIDLEYYGVSKYQVASHPDPGLPAIQALFRRLEFDVQVDQTRIHARYDKERALDLGDLLDGVTRLFHLVPYLMDADWIIGSLNLPPAAKAAVREAWTTFFADWGIIPHAELLTADRQRVRLGEERGPTGPREIAWDGAGAGPMPFRTPTALDLLALIEGVPDAVPLRRPGHAHWPDGPCGQREMERRLLIPLREALARGELAWDDGRLRAAPADLFEREDEAGALARALMEGGGDLMRAMQVARIVAPLERSLRFRDAGAINGCRVQVADLALRGDRLRLAVLRDPVGMIRLGLFAHGDRFFRRRAAGDDAWAGNVESDAARLLALLRAGSYQAPGMDAGAAPDDAAQAAALRDYFHRVRGPAAAPPLAGERVVSGHAASPGRAIGPALFGTDRRPPGECEHAVLIAPTLRPEDNAWLWRSAGIVSTGGGILSHVGLIAAQFKKPALIIPGRWVTDDGGRRTLLVRTQEYQEETRETDGWRISVWRDVREVEQPLAEGDLVALDADGGTLTTLGQDPDALALHRALHSLVDIGRRLGPAHDPGEVLALRGRRLALRFQIEKILNRLADPAVARHVAHELLLGAGLAEKGGDDDEVRTRLLAGLLANRHVGDAVRRELSGAASELERRLVETVRELEESLDRVDTLYAILGPRLDALHLRQSLDRAAALLADLGVEAPRPAAFESLDGSVRAALERLSQRVQADDADPDRPGRRHRLRQIGRFDGLLGRAEATDLARARDDQQRADNATRLRLAERRRLGPADGGVELYPLIGWKAAHLAELERLGARGLVPPWFAVTDRAFNEVMDAPLAPAGGSESPEAPTLRAAIDAVLARPDHDAARQSEEIARLWQRVILPDGLADDVLDGYRRLAAAECTDAAGASTVDLPYVAVRSSSLEEDAEVAARAGEFNTFLFVQGGERLIEHLRRAWSGLWTERAIHNRAVLGLPPARIGGGILVQRIVHARVAGVLLTANVAEREPNEMVINAGLGLGEGIVSGLVAADHVVVAREGDLERGPLRFRYITADKQEQVVHNRRTGLGTARVETRYHQRLRPALEYTELCELVRAAARLEKAYGFPLDIEWALEESHLRLLQCRPVPSFLAALRETIEEHPLKASTLEVKS